MTEELEQRLIALALDEDWGDGDHTSLACFDASLTGKARLIIKGDGILAGVEVAKKVFAIVDDTLEIEVIIEDGTAVKYGAIGMYVTGKKISILRAERIVLNLMQRMSGIATKTNDFVMLISHTNAKLLDTRKTTPGLRMFEKQAVKIGGGHNHRFGLYDRVMIKDNHVDYCGGIRNAIERVNRYLEEKGKNIPIEIEVRNEIELKEVLNGGQIDRIMLDNHSPEELIKAIHLIDGRFETEASGGIRFDTIVPYAETGVDFISVGALTHSFESLDISLKAMD